LNDTPRTDAVKNVDGWTLLVLCRQLERELATAFKAKEELSDARLRARTAALEAGYDGGDLAEIIRDLKRAKEEAERDAQRLNGLESLIKACPHSVITYNDDPDMDEPIGYSISIDGCEPVEFVADNLRAAIDEAMKK
jgi:hypothetical protein